jgi:hypothetical protein
LTWAHQNNKKIYFKKKKLKFSWKASWIAAPNEHRNPVKEIKSNILSEHNIYNHFLDFFFLWMHKFNMDDLLNSIKNNLVFNVWNLFDECT